MGYMGYMECVAKGQSPLGDSQEVYVGQRHTLQTRVKKQQYLQKLKFLNTSQVSL